MMHSKLLAVLLLCGCGEAFTPAGFSADDAVDGGGDSGGFGSSDAGGADGAGGSSAGGALALGGRSAGGAVNAGGISTAEETGAGGESVGGGDGGAPVECLTDLSGVGTGDFQISFTLTTTETVLTLALLNQRAGCDEMSAYWDVSLSSTGGVVVVMNDGSHRVFVVAGNPLNDGRPHRVDIIRRDGMFWYESDGVIHSTPTPNAYTFGAFPSLVLGSSDCAEIAPAAERAVVSDVCLTVP